MKPGTARLALNGKRIATSYPHLLKRYLDQKGISFKSCLTERLSRKSRPRAGLADAICDLVSTGATLEANGLREVEVIYRSKACLIQRDGEMAESEQQLIDKLLTRIQGVIQARESKYIMMHAPTERLDESHRPAARCRTPDHSTAGGRPAARSDAHGQ